MINESHVIADRELSVRFPEYRMLSRPDRALLLSYLEKRMSDQVLGDFGISAVMGIVSLVIILVSTGVGIAQLVKQARAEKEIGRYVTATEAVQRETAGILSEAQRIEQETKQKENMTKAALFGVLGIAGIAAAITFF